MIGAGQVSRFHLEGWRREGAARVVAIANRSLARAQERAREFGIENVYADIEEMLDAERLDAVDITAGPEMHRQASLAAAARGIAVMCQKPLAGSLAAARELVAEIDGRVPFMVHENWRFRPHYRWIRAWIAGGAIGEPRQFHLSAFGAGLLPDGEGPVGPLLRRQPVLAEMPRMITLELLVHHLDTLRFLCAQELNVSHATMRRRSPNVLGEDYAALMLDGADGVAGTLIGDWCVPDLSYGIHDRLDLVGTKGRICFDDGEAILIRSGQELRQSFDPEAGYQASYTNTIAHFAACLRDARPFESDAADNLRSLTLVEAAYEASGWPAASAA